MATAFGLLFAAPVRVAACTGCAPTFDEFVNQTASIVVVRWVAREGATDTFSVLDVLRGPSLRTVHLYSDYLGGRRPRGRWILIDQGYLAVLRVSPGGVVTDPLHEIDAIEEVPTTLAGWRAALLLLADTATEPQAKAPSSPGGAPRGWLLAAALAGTVVGFLRFVPGPPIDRLRRSHPG